VPLVSVVAAADRDRCATTRARVGIRPARILEASERVFIVVEQNGRRAASEYAFGTGILIRSEPINDVAAIVEDIPSINALSEGPQIADPIVESGANGENTS